MLSQRLKTVANRVPRGARVADIGCDHAYLPISLAQEGQVSYALGCDLNKGPLEAAKKNATRLGIDESKLELRLGNGLAPLAPGEVHCVTIAGMGAGLMRDILDASPEVVAGLKRIIVSPNIAPWLLRQWAMENNFLLEEETVVYEGGHYYEVFCMVPSEVAVSYSEQQLYFGNDIQAEAAVLQGYYAWRKESDQRLLSAWEEVRHTREDVAQKYDALTKLWQEWEEAHPCK